MKGKFIVILRDGTQKHYRNYASAVKCFLGQGYRIKELDEKLLDVTEKKQ